MRTRTRSAVLLVVTLLIATAIPAQAAPPMVDVIVVLDEEAPAPGAVAYEVRSRFGGVVGAVYEHALHGFSMSIPEPAVAGLARHPHVAWIEPDVEVSVAQVDEEVLPTGIDRIDADVNPMDPTLAIGAAGSTVEVAVLDTGIDAAHPDLDVRYYTDCTDVIAFELLGQLILSGSCAADGNPYDEDGHGHGTHVSGIIGARAGNGLGVVGVAPDVRLWSIKVLEDNGTGGLGGILAGIDVVVSQAYRIAVANMSFGFEGYSAALDEAVSNATDAGVVFVAAAGNGAMDVSGFAPASSPDAVTVSALNDWDGAPGGLGATTACYASDPDDTLAPFSNYGAGVDVAAPGTCILSTMTGGGYATWSGTSMAAPHVTGAIARYIAEQEAANGPFPDDRSGVEAILAGFFDVWTVPADAAVGFVDDSGDGIAEPLLYLGGAVTPPSNTAPVAEDDAFEVGFETPLSIAAPGVLGNDTDADGDLLAAVEVTGPSHGSLALATDGSFTYTPAPGFAGADAFTYSATDGVAESAPATVTITVGGPGLVHLGGIAGVAEQAQRGRWSAVVTVTVHDEGHAPQAGATVSGAWETGQADSCVTGADGACVVTRPNLKNNVDSVGFTVGDVTVDGAAYDPDANDVGTSVTVYQGGGPAEPPPGSVLVDVAQLEGSVASAPRNRWDATVTISIVDDGSSPVVGVVVTGSWDVGGSGSCTTDVEGRCEITLTGIKQNAGAVTFAVTALSGDVPGGGVYGWDDTISQADTQIVLVSPLL